MRALALLLLVCACTKEKPASTAPVTAEEARALYESHCALCHGLDGKSHTAMAGSLTPRPQDLTDPAWNSRTTNGRISDTIRKGGEAMGLSAVMPANPDLSEGQAEAMTRYIRALAQPRHEDDAGQ